MARLACTLCCCLLLLSTAHALVAGFNIRSTEWPAHGDPSALILAEEAAKESVVGQVGLQVRSLTETGLLPSDWPYIEKSGAIIAPRALLCGLTVDPAFRRRGLAAELCLACEEEVRSWDGFQELMLFVDERNENAIALYRKLGYEYANPAAIAASQAAASERPGLFDFIRKATQDPLCMTKKL